MDKELLRRVQFELVDVLNSINNDKIHHDGDDFHELLLDVEAALEEPASEDSSVAQQRTWVGLTDEDTFKIAERLGLSDVAWVDLMQAIEAKLKEKNV
jgi:hypothetical protein